MIDQRRFVLDMVFTVLEMKKNIAIFDGLGIANQKKGTQQYPKNNWIKFLYLMNGYEHRHSIYH